MCNSKTYVRKSHSGNVLSKCHSLTSLFLIIHCITQRSWNDLDCFQMEHICHFPCSLSCISLDCMCQGIHTGGSCQSFWHGGHHIRINDRDHRHVVRINTDKFSLSLHIRDNVVDCNFCCCTSGCRYCNDRYAWFFRGCNSLKTSDILKFRIGNNDSDRFWGIHRRSSTDCDQVISFRFLKCLNAVLYILDRRVCFDIWINFISKSVFVKNIRYLFCNTKFDQIRIRTYKCFFESTRLCLCCNLFDRSCSVVRCFV